MMLPAKYIIQADAEHLPLPDDAVDLTFCSPPYTDARWYGDQQKHARKCGEWVDWMLRVVTELCRVTKGLVLVNCAGVTRGRIYQPGPEGLLYEWWKRGGICWRPCYWHRVGIPGSGGKHWLRADIEYVLAFKRTKEWPDWSDNTANGHVPKWAPGGEMSYRQSSGTRRNAWGQSPNQLVRVRMANGQRDERVRAGRTELIPPSAFNCGPTRRANGNYKAVLRDQWGFAGTRGRGRFANGEPKPDFAKTDMSDEEIVARGGKRHTKLDAGEQANGEALREQVYLPPVKANPGNMIRVKVGGGLLGHPDAHLNEAPFPVDLAAWFIKSFCRPNGIVLDSFCGSGTTAHAAIINGRRAIVSDIRFSQCELSRRRLASSINPPRRARKRKSEPSLFEGVTSEARKAVE